MGMIIDLVVGIVDIPIWGLELIMEVSSSPVRVLKNVKQARRKQPLSRFQEPQSSPKKS